MPFRAQELAPAHAVQEAQRGAVGGEDGQSCAIAHSCRVLARRVRARGVVEHGRAAWARAYGTAKALLGEDDAEEVLSHEACGAAGVAHEGTAEDPITTPPCAKEAAAPGAPGCLPEADPSAHTQYCKHVMYGAEGGEARSGLHLVHKRIASTLIHAFLHLAACAEVAPDVLRLARGARCHAYATAGAHCRSRCMPEHGLP
mmetsp:Transcript_15983/g.43085  ORF Transcript_15983/g.43085 Transcript_15983/m.43085 type:complete len:201 (-) Transcript_15983:108-710(-)